jgi:trehalose-phosphatase
LFDCWTQVVHEIKNARSIQFFLDFDGTLAGYCNRPGDLKLSARVRGLLARLCRRPNLHMAIVSGRRNAALREYIEVPGIQFMGLFGWETRARRRLPRRTLNLIRDLRTMLAPVPTLFPGVTIEDKGVSYAVHFRGTSSEVIAELRSWVEKLVVRLQPAIGLIRTHTALDIVPRQVQGKGAALREYIRSVREPFLPIYVGDDLTDEPAFVVLQNGITVRVGPASRTQACFRVKDPEEVHTFLERFEDELP